MRKVYKGAFSGEGLDPDFSARGRSLVLVDGSWKDEKFWSHLLNARSLRGFERLGVHGAEHLDKPPLSEALVLIKRRHKGKDFVVVKQNEELDNEYVKSFDLAI
jgi:hypothetical protein